MPSLDGREEAAATPRVLVVGLGNPLMADDGAGVAVAERLQATELPAGARAEVGGTDSLRLLSLWRGEEEVWLVDAVVRDAPPGTIHRLTHEEILSTPQRHASAHVLSLPESLRTIAAVQPDMARVRFRLWGIEPESVAPAPGLTPRVAAGAETLAVEIVSELRALSGESIDDGGGRRESRGIGFGKGVER